MVVMKETENTILDLKVKKVQDIQVQKVVNSPDFK